MQIDFTTGSIGKKIFLFTLPLMAGDVFQQLYNVVDTAIVGRALGADALAAVGSTGSLPVSAAGWACNRCQRYCVTILGC